jgi:hypothetical protein
MVGLQMLHGSVSQQIKYKDSALTDSDAFSSEMSVRSVSDGAAESRGFLCAMVVRYVGPGDVGVEVEV